MGECGDQEQVPGWYVVEEEPRTHGRYCIAAKQHNIGEGVEGFTLFQAWFNVLEEEELSEGSISLLRCVVVCMSAMQTLRNRETENPGSFSKTLFILWSQVTSLVILRVLMVGLMMNW